MINKYEINQVTVICMNFLSWTHIALLSFMIKHEGYSTLTRPVLSKESSIQIAASLITAKTASHITKINSTYNSITHFGINFSG